MKLFIWDDVLTDYTSGIIFAYAETLEDARQMVLEKQVEQWGYDSPAVAGSIAHEPEIYDTKPTVRIIWGGG